MESVIVQIGQAILLSSWDLITFPWWWYSRGLLRVGSWARVTLRGWERAVGLRLWARSLFVPMYGQRDWQGRVISFFMRLVVLIGRLVQVAVGSIVVLVVIIGYIALPPMMVLQIIRSMLGV